MSKATFPITMPNVRKFFSSAYKSWWEKVHERFLEDNLQILVNALGCVTDGPQEHKEEALVASKLPISKSKIHTIEIPPHEEVQQKKTHVQTYQVSNKRVSQDESSSSHEDRCWKKVKPSLDKPRDTNSHAVEILTNNSSSSRTLTVIKESSDVEILEASPQSKSQDSSYSVAVPASRRSLSPPNSEREATSIPHGKTNSHKQPKATMSVFDGRRVVSELRKNFILEAWSKVRAKLVGLTADRASSLKDEVQVILADMDGMGVDISPLKSLLGSFFKLAASYDRARSSLADKTMEIEKSESYLGAKEHLELALSEKDEKSKELSAALESLKEARKQVKELKTLRDAAKKGVEEAESKVSIAEEEYHKCGDISLATAKASDDVEKRKRGLEATLQDLVNYKLCLDCILTYFIYLDVLMFAALSFNFL